MSDKYLNGEYLRNVNDLETCVKVYEKIARSLLDRHTPGKKNYWLKDKLYNGTQMRYTEPELKSGSVRGSGEQPNSSFIRKHLLLQRIH